MPSETPVQIARRLAAEFAGRAAEADAAGALPPEDLFLLHRSGYLKLVLPAAWGGRASGLEELAAAQVILASGNASTALVAAMTVMLAGYARDAGHWEGERERLFAIVREGGLVNALASEPELGSPSRGGLPGTRLTPQGNEYQLDGHKTWSTGGRHLSHLIVLAALDDKPVQVLVPNHAPGVTWHETWGRGLSLRASESHDVAFDKVRLGADQLLGLGTAPASEKPNPWFVALVAATYLGTARAARDAAVDFALQRVPSGLGHPIAELATVRRQLGALQSDYFSAKAALLRAARAWDDERQALPLALAKRVASEAALRVTEGALRLAGGTGLSHELPLERHFRDARGSFGHPPGGDALLERLGTELIDKRRT